MFKFLAVTALVLAASCTAVLGKVNPVYEQCGGLEFTGATDCANADHMCTYVNHRISLCLPRPETLAAAKAA